MQSMSKSTEPKRTVKWSTDARWKQDYIPGKFQTAKHTKRYNYIIWHGWAEAKDYDILDEDWGG